MLIPLGKVTLVKDVHCVNIPLGSVVTVGGIVILTKLEHPWNAFSPKLVTLDGIVILIKLMQSLHNCTLKMRNQHNLAHS